jgi:hypothetical protein
MNRKCEYEYHRALVTARCTFANWKHGVEQPLVNRSELTPTYLKHRACPETRVGPRN